MIHLIVSFNAVPRGSAGQVLVEKRINFKPLYREPQILLQLFNMFGKTAM